MLDLTRRQKKMLALSLLGAAALYLGFVLYTGFDDFVHAAGQLGVGGWGLILACSSGNYLLRFIRWNFYLHRFNHRLPLFLHFNYYMSAFALTTTPGKAGETIRSLYLKSHHIPFTHSLAMFFTERFLDVVVVTLLATLSLLSLDQYGEFVLLAAIVLALMLPLLRSRLVIKTLQHLAGRIALPSLSHFIQHISVLLDSARRLLQWQNLYTGLILGVAAWSIQGLAFYFILSTLGPDLGLTTAMSIYAISLLAGALSFVPGGIGTTEAVMGLLLLHFGADNVSAVAIPVISRISTLWFAVTLGLISSSYLGISGAAAKTVAEK